MRPYHVIHENEDPDIKKIKKVIEDPCAFVSTSLFSPSGFCGCKPVVSMGTLSLVSPPPGAELHARLALSPEVEDHRSGLHLLSSRREHEKEEPDCLQHGGG